MDPQPLVKANPNNAGGLDLSGIMGSLSHVSVIELCIALFFSGVTAVFLAELYRRYSKTTSNRDSFARLFPMITITTTVVIFVVKSSLALSLGLVGALSIVRFRAAIKEPEELMYLFMCIALGLSFGANMPLIAVLGLCFFVAFVTLYQFGLRKKKRNHNMLVSLVFDTESQFEEIWDKVETVLREECELYSFQRAELGRESCQINVSIRLAGSASSAAFLAKLRGMPCEISYINLDTML